MMNIEPTKEEVQFHRDMYNTSISDAYKAVKKQKVRRALSCANSIEDLRTILEYVLDNV